MLPCALLFALQVCARIFFRVFDDVVGVGDVPVFFFFRRNSSLLRLLHLRVFFFLLLAGVSFSATQAPVDDGMKNAIPGCGGKGRR